MYTITLIRGDGIGPEISEATRSVIEATGVPVKWEIEEAGEDIYKKEGNPLPQRVLDSIRKNRVAIKGPVTTPVGTGFRSVNVELRRTLDLYCCLRPCKLYRGVKSRYEKVDIVIVRENTEDLYCGVEFEKGSDGAKAIMEAARRCSGVSQYPPTIREDSAISLKPISVYGSERIVRFAFDYARRYKRRKVTAVHKANIMKATDGLFLEVAREVAKSYPDIGFEDRIVDNMCMQIVQKPELYDVLVMPNLYGDIISDLVAGLIGGLGMAPGANIGKDIAIFEPTHGSAPKYKGMNKVNPMAMILSGVMMLNYLGEEEAAERVERAITSIIAEGKWVTYDLKPRADDPTSATTSQVAEAIIARMKSYVPKSKITKL